MNLSCSATACPEADLPGALTFARNAGFSGIELFCNWTKSTPVQPGLSAQAVRDHLRDHDVTLTGLNIGNLTGLDPDTKERNLDANLNRLERDIDLARELGLNSVNLKGGGRTQEALEDLIEGINRLLERVPDVTLNLGNHRGNRLQGLSDYQAVMSRVGDRAKVLIDTGHLLPIGEDILAFAEAFAGRIGLVHLRDQKGDEPVPFGEGDLPFEDLFRLLKASGYDGTLVVELEHVTWDDPLRATRTAREYVEAVLGRVGGR